MKDRAMVSAIFLLLLFLKLPSAAQENYILGGKYLIVLDMQEIATKDMMEAEAAKELIDVVNRIIELSDSDKVIYIESISASLEISLTGLSVKFKPGLFLDDRLKIVSDNKFVKNKANAFTSEQLSKFIERRNARDFVVVGLMAEHCVIETLLGGKKSGFNMFMIPGAIAGLSEEGKLEALNNALKFGIKKIELDNLTMKN